MLERRALSSSAVFASTPLIEPSSVDPDPTDAGVEPTTPHDDAAAGASGTRSRRYKRWRHRWKQLRRKVGLAAVAVCGRMVLGTLSRTWKLALLGAERLEHAQANHRGHFMALWHGRMIVGLAHHRSLDWYVLVSSSADGDISQSVLESFRYKVIRGSSSRGGARALRAMLDVLASGAVVIITPDGPRGPRHSMEPGLAWLARATGFPVVPVGFGVDRAWRLKRWDRFTIPKPGARIAMVYGTPVEVARDASSADMEAASRAIHDALVAAETEAFAHLAVPSDW